MRLHEKLDCAGDTALRLKCRVILCVGCPTLRRQRAFLYTPDKNQTTLPDRMQHSISLDCSYFLCSQDTTAKASRKLLARLVKQLA